MGDELPTSICQGNELAARVMRIAIAGKIAQFEQMIDMMQPRRVRQVAGATGVGDRHRAPFRCRDEQIEQDIPQRIAQLEIGREVGTPISTPESHFGIFGQPHYLPGTRSRGVWNFKRWALIVPISKLPSRGNAQNGWVLT